MIRAQSEVTLIAPGGIRAAIEQLIPAFEKKTGIKVKPTFGSGLGTKKQVASGEPFDVPIVQPPYPEVLASGNVVAASAKPLASISIGVAVKKGAPKPDISTPEAVKKMLLAAKSVAYPNPAGGAAAGVAFDATLKQLGIAEQMEPKLKRAQGGAGAMTMAANGEVGNWADVPERDGGSRHRHRRPAAEADRPADGAGGVRLRPREGSRRPRRSWWHYLSSREAAAAYKAQRMVPGK